MTQPQETQPTRARLSRRLRFGVLFGGGLSLFVASTLALLQFLPAQAATQGNLVGYWKLDETTGTTAADASGNGNGGTYIGSPTPIADAPTNSFNDTESLSFNGSNEVDVSNTSAADITTGDFTLSTWFKTSNANATDQIMLLKQFGPGYLMGLDSSGHPYFSLYDGTSTLRDAKGTTDYRDGQWHQVTITFARSGNATFYVDGQSLGTTDISALTGSLSNTHVLTISSNGAYKYTGALDDVRVYSRALSSAEVTELGTGNNTTATWTGAIGINFGTAGNWDIGAVPDAFTNIEVPQTTHPLYLNMNAQLSNLHIGASAGVTLNGFNLTFNDGGTFSNDGILTLNGNETLTNFTNDTDSGSVFYVGTSSGGGYTGLPTGTNYYTLTFQGAGPWTVNAPLQVNNILSQWSGTVNTGDNAITVLGSWDQYGGTFNAGASSLNITSNWAHSGGTFNAGTSTVNFKGSHASITGDNTFYNLSMSKAAGTLLFPAGKTQTIQNQLTLAGAAGSGNSLSLASDNTGTQAKIDPQGSVTASYLNVQDNNNINAAMITAANSTSGGNNTGWDITPPTVTIPATDAFSGGYWDDDSTPTLTLTTADSDSTQVKYRLQVSKNSDFSSPVVDYTSALASPGNASFTVGQAAGSGSYSVGSSGQTLSDGSYYWRVMAIDDGDLSSSWTASNAGAVAFKVDTTAPGTPSASTTGGYYNADQSVTLSASDSGSGLSSIYYTTNGDTPTTASTKYTGAISVSSDLTLKAIAYDKVGNPSGVMSQTYQIDTTKLIGGSAVSNELGTTSNITDLQVSSDETNPTVTVKLFVSHGTISMSTTAGLTFYDNNGTSLGATQPSDAASLQFGGTMSAINAALASLHYSRTDGTTGADTLSASLIPQGSAYYPANGHLYQYVAGPSAWADAKAAASTSSKYGAQGYLATITSQGENDFILAQLKSDSWIGASDDTSVGTTEGNWIWATGPEAGQQFWQGTGTALPASGSVVGGMYNNWNNSANGDPMSEPNDSNVNGENCAEFYYRTVYDGHHPNGTWNDYTCDSPLGYIIEYGGLGGINPTVASKSVTITSIDTTAPNGPAFSPAGGTFGSSQSVTLSATDNTGGSGIGSIYYTTNGDAPTSSSTKYTGAISVNATETVKAVAYDKSGNASNVTSAAYVIDTTAPSVPGTPTAATGSTDTTPTWNWTASTDSGGSVLKNPAYTVQWSQSSTFASGVSTDTTNGTSYTNATALADNSVWYFRVRASDAVGNDSAWSSASIYINTTALTGGSAITNEQGKTSAITDLQVTSGQSNPTVYVKLYVNAGVISLGTTTGLTFYNASGTSLGTSQPANTSQLHIGGTLTDVNTALKTLTYKRTAAGTGTDTLSAALVNPGAAFFSGNGHLYEYYGASVTWDQAKSNADSRTRYGAQGYLATITSQSENNFIQTQLKSDSWIGASDAASEGVWKWVDGPENGQQFWQGNGQNAGSNTVNGMYAHWNNPNTGGSGQEPNDSGGNEDCAEFYYSNNGLWNDLSCSSTLGYIVEYGGLNGINPTVASKSVAITTTADATPPTKPGTPTSAGSPTADNTPTISWTASTDSGSGLKNPAYTLEWSTSATFDTITGSGTTNSTSLAPPSGLADGTWYFRVTATDNSGNAAASDISAAVTIDTTSPVVDAFTPADDASAVATNSSLTIEFNEPVVTQSGNIVIHKASDDSTVETIAVSSSQVVGSGTNTLTIFPAADLAYDTGYYVTVDAAAAADQLGNAFAGISGATTWNFTTTKSPAQLALEKIEAYADSDGASTAPTAADYTTAGVHGVSTDNLALLNNYVANSDSSSVSNVADIQTFADKAAAITVIQQYANSHGGTAAPTVTDYTNAGVTGVTSGNLAAINQAVVAAGSINLDSPELIQSLVTSTLAPRQPASQPSTPPRQTASAPAASDDSAADDNSAKDTPQKEDTIQLNNATEKPDQNATDANGKNTGAFLGLGWWWLLVLAALFFWWLLAVRRRDDDDQNGPNKT